MTDIRETIEARPRKSRRQIQDQFRTLIRQADDLAEGLDTEALTRRPAPDQWSPIECIDHLNVMARLYLPILTEAIQDARAEGLDDDASRRGPQGGSDGRSIIGRILTWSQEPPPRFRMKTFEESRPGKDLDPAAVLDEFEALHEEIIVRINESGTLDRKKIKIRSVLDRRLRLTLEDWFWFLAAHARRHLWQAADAAYGAED